MSMESANEKHSDSGRVSQTVQEEDFAKDLEKERIFHSSLKGTQWKLQVFQQHKSFFLVFSPNTKNAFKLLACMTYHFQLFPKNRI